METITLTFNSNSPFAANLEAFLKTIPQDVKVSKSVKPARKRITKKERFLDELKEAGREAKQLAKKHTATRTLDDIIAEL